jgi:anti-sigma-K factor RskA
VTPDHERIDELLAGYVLRGLSGEDAAEADALLSEHVPGCVACRQTLGEFQELAADLALDAAPMAPPETLLPRLHRELEPVGRRRRPMQLFVVAAGVVAVVGLAGLAVTQNHRASHSRSRLADMSAALDLASKPGARVVPVGPAREISTPGSTVVYLYGTGVPQPPAGEVYRVWLVSQDNIARYVGDLPIEDGIAFAQLSFDATTVAAVMITIEPQDSTPNQPGQVAWRSAA